MGGWLVTLAPSARAKRVRQELPALLQALEASGVREVRTLRDSTSGVALAARLLDVVTMRQSDTQYPGSIYITLELPIERTGGFVAATVTHCVDGPATSYETTSVRTFATSYGDQLPMSGTPF